MAPLHRALALEEVHDVAVRVGEDLNLDVTRPLDQPLDVERAVAERRASLRAARAGSPPQISPRRAHAPSCRCRRRRRTA